MTTIGVLSIILGSLGVLLALLVSLVGGLLAGAGSEMAGTGFVEGEQFGTTVAMGGSIILLIGIATLGINLMLLISGVGVLKMAPWGRRLSISYGVLGILVFGVSLASQGFGLFNAAYMAYSVVLVAMFMTPGWKAAFSSVPEVAAEPATSSSEPESQDVRDAA